MMKNKRLTHLNFTILMSDGFFFLPDLLLQNEFLSEGVKGIKWVDNDDDDFITVILKKKTTTEMTESGHFNNELNLRQNNSSFKGVALIPICLTMQEDLNNQKL